MILPSHRDGKGSGALPAGWLRSFGDVVDSQRFENGLKTVLSMRAVFFWYADGPCPVNCIELAKMDIEGI